MRGWLIGIVFAVFAIVFCEDDGARRFWLLAAHIWFAAAYARGR